VLRRVDQDVVDEVHRQMNEPEFRKKILGADVENGRAVVEAKQNQCLARAKYRGRPIVQVQAYLIATVQNIRRLLFPLVALLLTHGPSYSISTAPMLPSHQLRSPTNR
jgi:hypothetical protein